MSRILVSEELAEGGLAKLRAAGHEVDVQVGLSPEQLHSAIKGAHALIVRSATQVDEALLAAADDLVVVGRAGVGLDNVDVESATKRGVMVANAPESNIVSAAELAVSLLLAVARNVVPANLALKNGQWKRSQFGGVELQDKTVGIIGMGKIGMLVAQRLAGFDMKFVAYDPYVKSAPSGGPEIKMVSLDELLAESDFVTIHIPKTAETNGLIDTAALAKMKPTAFVINAARGGVLDESALFDALTAGTIAGAGLDVYATEPCTDSPLFALDNVVATPHLGASTEEAQEKAGVAVAESVVAAFAGTEVPGAVNAELIS